MDNWLFKILTFEKLVSFEDNARNGRHHFNNTDQEGGQIQNISIYKLHDEDTAHTEKTVILLHFPKRHKPDHMNKQ